MLHRELQGTTPIVYQIMAAVAAVVVAIFAPGVGSIVTRAYAAPTTSPVSYTHL